MERVLATYKKYEAVSKQCDQIGRFFNIHGNKFGTKEAKKYW